MITVWGRTNSVNVQKVMWTIDELGLAHERIDAGGKFGLVDTPEFAEMNPMKRIPVIRDGDDVIWESNAIVRYLAAKYGVGTLCPEDLALRARSDAWMDWMLAHLMPDMTVVFWQLIRTPEDARDMDAVAAAAQRLMPIWRVLDDHLADQRYVAGPHLSMGDIPVGCLYWRYINLDMERANLPNCHLWFQNLKGKPAYQKNVMLPVT